MKKTPFQFSNCESEGQISDFWPRFKIKAILLFQVNVLTETNMPENIMLVHDGHFCASLKKFSSSLQTYQILKKSHFYKFLNFWSQSTSYNFVNCLFMSIFWTVNH